MPAVRQQDQKPKGQGFIQPKVNVSPFALRSAQAAVPNADTPTLGKKLSAKRQEKESFKLRKLLTASDKDEPEILSAKSSKRRGRPVSKTSSKNNEAPKKRGRMAQNVVQYQSASDLKIQKKSDMIKTGINPDTGKKLSKAELDKLKNNISAQTVRLNKKKQQDGLQLENESLKLQFSSLLGMIQKDIPAEYKMILEASTTSNSALKWKTFDKDRFKNNLNKFMGI